MELLASALFEDVMDRMRIEEQRTANSKASIQHFPAACDGARKMRCEEGSGWTTAPVSIQHQIVTENITKQI